METSTVVPGGDLAGRSAEYRRGYWRGVWDAGPAAPVAMALTCAAWFFGAWCAERADRAEAQLEEMRKRTHMCIALTTDGMCHCSHYEAPRPALLPLTGGTITTDANDANEEVR